MPVLKETKNNHYHFYENENGNLQGEGKAWHVGSGQLILHCIYKDGSYHGEHKQWYTDKTLLHHFYQENINITNEVMELVSDMNNITDEEKLIIKIKFGIECLN